jgi:hypothetical protein
MRHFAVTLFVAMLLGGYAFALDQSNNVNAPGSQIVLTKLIKKRVCATGEERCACADTGTSACCKPNQRCVCSPTANCK